MSFVKGQSGNPKGRPKNEDGIKSFREWLAKNRHRRQEILGELMESEDQKVRMDAIKHADAYDYGKPSQNLELTGKDGQALQPIIFSVSGIAKEG